MLTIQKVSESRGPGSDPSLPSSNPFGSNSSTFRIVESGATFTLHTGSYQYASQGEYPVRLDCPPSVRSSLHAAFGVDSDAEFVNAFEANPMRWPDTVTLLSMRGDVRWSGGVRIAS